MPEDQDQTRARERSGRYVGTAPWVHPDPDAVRAVPDPYERLLAANRALAAAERTMDELLLVRQQTVQAIYDDPDLTATAAAEHLELDQSRIRQYRKPPPTTRGNRRFDPGPDKTTRLDTTPPHWAR